MAGLRQTAGLRRGSWRGRFFSLMVPPELLYWLRVRPRTGPRAGSAVRNLRERKLASAFREMRLGPMTATRRQSVTMRMSSHSTHGQSAQGTALPGRSRLRLHGRKVQSRKPPLLAENSGAVPRPSAISKTRSSGIGESKQKSWIRTEGPDELSCRE